MPSHDLRYTANCSMLFTELPLLERPAAARAAGFDAIELWWPFAEAVPADADADALVAAIEDAGVELNALNLFAGDMAAGDRGVVSWPGRERELAANLEVVAAIAGRLGTKSFNALYGNRLDGAAPEAQDELAAANLAAACDALAGLGGTVLVEPVSGAPRYPLLTAAGARSAIERAGRRNLRLLADLYHLTVNGDDLDALAADAAAIGHVQIADAPGRGEPGTGTLDLDALLAALQAGGYAGSVGLEYKPTTSTEASLAWLPRESRASA